MHIRQHQQLLLAEISEKFDVKPEEQVDLPFSLYSSAIIGHKSAGLNSIESYNLAMDDGDCSGHWQILPAFGNMKSEGLFSGKDLRVLATNNAIFEATKKAGLLKESPSGSYSWKEGIGPFSQEWKDICRPLWNKIPE